MRGVVAPLIKLSIFLVITALATYVLGATISNSSYGAAKLYKADFVDASGVQLGDDVRIAGVRVGDIEGITIKRNKDNGKLSYAEVTFTVQKSRPLPKSISLYLRYRNLVGQRYLDVEQGASTDHSVLSSKDTIPIAQTHPAVDLTVLFAGFEPLTQGLDPGQINSLSMEIIQTLQGEGGALENLLTRLASLTNALADKDQVIGDVIDNLSGVLQALGNKDNELRNLIVQLSNVLHGLAQDRKTIGNSIDGINRLATSTAGLLTQVRAPLAKNIKDITGLVSLLNRNKSTVQYVVQQLPPTLAGLIRTATYGSWFNFYLCTLSGQIGIGDLNIPANDLVKTGGSGGRCGS